jgi:hypothetical protein
VRAHPNRLGAVDVPQADRATEAAERLDPALAETFDAAVGSGLKGEVKKNK